MSGSFKVRINHFSRGVSKSQLARDFARNILLPKQGSLHIISRNAAIGNLLLDKGIKNILVSQTPKLEIIESQLARVLGVKAKAWQSAAIVEPSIFFNAPEFLQKGILHTSGKVLQETTDASKHTTITLDQVRSGLTDFGEEMLRFMELNKIDSLQILTDLTIPLYQKVGYGGAIAGNKLGMRGDVSRWNTVVIRTKENCGALCYDCIIACPAGAIKPFQTAASPMAGGVKINSDACKGCQLCITACTKETFWPGAQNE